MFMGLFCSLVGLFLGLFLHMTNDDLIGTSICDVIRLFCLVLSASFALLCSFVGLFLGLI